jgi:orotate phosphoribosyltransferase
MTHFEDAAELSQLKDILRSKSVRFGAFTLTSGGTSDV